MTEKKFFDPGIGYTASRLSEYAREHGVDVDTQYRPPISVLDSDGPASRALRHGYGIAPTFEVADSVPRTIPLILARLAIFDNRLHDPATVWELDEKFGVFHDHVSWLRLVQVEPTDDRVGEILSIVGARHDSYTEGIEQDECGNTVPYTNHYYLESPNYAVKVARMAPDRHLGMPVTAIQFKLPDRSRGTA